MQQQAKLFTQALLTVILFSHPKSNHNNTVLWYNDNKIFKAAIQLLNLSYDQLIGKDAYDPQWAFVDENGLPLELSKYPVNQVLNSKQRIENKTIGLIDHTTKDISWFMVNAYMEGHEGAKLAIEMFCYRLAKYISGYMIAVPSLDAIVFTGGIGENSSLIRETTMGYFSHLGVDIDTDRNLQARFGKGGDIASDSSNKRVFVVPTNEEWVIAAEAATFA